MSSILNRLKKNGKTLQASVERGLAPQGGESDPRMYSVARGNDGNGYAVVRFLPRPPEERQIASVIQYKFVSPVTGMTYQELSLKSIGLADPMADYWSMLWQNQRIEEAKQINRSFSNYANVLILKDKVKPENDMKVKIFRFGKTIKDMLDDVTKAKEGSVNPALNPFFPWGYSQGVSDEEQANWVKEFGNPGANFIIQVRTKGDKFPSYEASHFDWPSTLGIGGRDFSDDKLGAIIDQAVCLDEFVAPEKFKSYDELKARLDKVLGVSGSRPAPSPISEQRQAPASEPEPTTSTGDEDDDYARLQSLISEVS